MKSALARQGSLSRLQGPRTQAHSAKRISKSVTFDKTDEIIQYVAPTPEITEENWDQLSLESCESDKHDWRPLPPPPNPPISDMGAKAEVHHEVELATPEKQVSTGFPTLPGDLSSEFDFALKNAANNNLNALETIEASPQHQQTKEQLLPSPIQLDSSGESNDSSNTLSGSSEYTDELNRTPPFHSSLIREHSVSSASSEGVPVWRDESAQGHLARQDSLLPNQRSLQTVNVSPTKPPPPSAEVNRTYSKRREQLLSMLDPRGPGTGGVAPPNSFAPIPEEPRIVPTSQSTPPGSDEETPSQPAQPAKQAKQDKQAAKQADIPAKQADIPAKQADIPAKQATKQADIPEKQSNKQAEQPTKQSDIPVKQTDKQPTKQTDIPVKQTDRQPSQTLQPLQPSQPTRKPSQTNTEGSPIRATPSVESLRFEDPPTPVHRVRRWDAFPGVLPWDPSYDTTVDNLAMMAVPPIPQKSPERDRRRSLMLDTPLSALNSNDEWVDESDEGSGSEESTLEESTLEESSPVETAPKGVTLEESSFESSVEDSAKEEESIDNSNLFNVRDTEHVSPPVPPHQVKHAKAPTQPAAKTATQPVAKAPNQPVANTTQPAANSITDTKPVDQPVAKLDTKPDTKSAAPPVTPLVAPLNSVAPLSTSKSEAVQMELDGVRMEIDGINMESEGVNMAKNARNEARGVDLEARGAEIEARGAELEARGVELESKAPVQAPAVKKEPSFKLMPLPKFSPTFASEFLQEKPQRELFSEPLALDSELSEESALSDETQDRRPSLADSDRISVNIEDLNLPDDQSSVIVHNSFDNHGLTNPLSNINRMSGLSMATAHTSFEEDISTEPPKEASREVRKELPKEPFMGDLSLRDYPLRDSLLKDYSLNSLKEYSLSSLEEPSLREYSLGDPSLRDSSLRDSSLREPSLGNLSLRDAEPSLAEPSLAEPSFGENMVSTFNSLFPEEEDAPERRSYVVRQRSKYVVATSPKRRTAQSSAYEVLSDDREGLPVDQSEIPRRPMPTPAYKAVHLVPPTPVAWWDEPAAPVTPKKVKPVESTTPYATPVAKPPAAKPKKVLDMQSTTIALAAPPEPVNTKPDVFTSSKGTDLKTAVKTDTLKTAPAPLKAPTPLNTAPTKAPVGAGVTPLKTAPTPLKTAPTDLKTSDLKTAPTPLKTAPTDLKTSDLKTAPTDLKTAPTGLNPDNAVSTHTNTKHEAQLKSAPVKSAQKSTYEVAPATAALLSDQETSIYQHDAHSPQLVSRHLTATEQQIEGLLYLRINGFTLPKLPECLATLVIDNGVHCISTKPVLASRLPSLTKEYRIGLFPEQPCTLTVKLCSQNQQPLELRSLEVGADGSLARFDIAPVKKDAFGRRLDTTVPGLAMWSRNPTERIASMTVGALYIPCVSQREHAPGTLTAAEERIAGARRQWQGCTPRMSGVLRQYGIGTQSSYGKKRYVVLDPIAPLLVVHSSRSRRARMLINLAKASAVEKMGADSFVLRFKNKDSLAFKTDSELLADQWVSALEPVVGTTANIRPKWIDAVLYEST